MKRDDLQEVRAPMLQKTMLWAACFVGLGLASPAFADVKQSCLESQQDPHSVLAACEAFLATHPAEQDIAASHYNLGVAYLMLGINYLALASFDQAIAKNANLYGPWAGRAEAHLRLRKFDLARQDIDKALAINPDSPDGQDIRALIAVELKQNDDLLTASEKEIKLNPSGAEGYERRGEAYTNGGKFNKANADFRRAASLKPAWAFAWARLGTSYAIMGNSAAAREAFDRALAIDPHAIEALVNRGKLDEEAGKAEAAIAEYRSALMNPTDLTRERQFQKEALAGLKRLINGIPPATPLASASRPSNGAP